MKRGGPLKRTKPLDGGDALRRSTPLRSGHSREGKAQPPAKRKSLRRGVNEDTAREVVYARSGRVCERCGHARATEWHHRKNRSQGGLWEGSNGLDLCTPCHRTVTDTNGHREEYEAMGWIVPGWQDPAAVPAYIWHHGVRRMYLLDDEGGVVPAPFPESDPRHPDDIPWSPPAAPLDGVA